MIELVKYMHTTHNFECVLPGKYMSDPIEARFGWYRQANGVNFFMSIKQLLLAEKNCVLNLLQQKALVAASQLISVQSVGLDWSPPSEPPECYWLHAFFMEREVDNLQEMCESDANLRFLLVDTLDAVLVVGENVQHVKT